MLLNLSPTGDKKVVQIKIFSNILISSQYFCGFKPNKDGRFPRDTSFDGKTLAQSKEDAYARFQEKEVYFEEMIEKYCSTLAICLAFWKMCELNPKYKINIRGIVFLRDLEKHDEFVLLTTKIDNIEFIIDPSKMLSGSIFHTLQSIESFKCNTYIYPAEQLKL